MAVFTAGTSYTMNMDAWNPREALLGVSAGGSLAQHQVRDASGDFENFYGSGLKSNSAGDLYAGSINRIDSYYEGVRHFDVSGLAATVSGLFNTGNAASAWAYLLYGNDTIYGAGGGDILNGFNGNDSIYGKDGDDTLRGGSGHDLLAGGLGKDRMVGGTGNDTFYISRADDVIVEYANEGIDKAIASASYRLETDVSVRTLSAEANAGAISLTGNNYENVVVGNVANNRLSGGEGIDYLYGDEGADIFDFNSRFDSYAPISGSDVIDDFFRSENDRIDVSDIDASTAYTGNQKFSFIGGLEFSGDGLGGELRVVRYAEDGYSQVSADIDGDGKADFGIEVDGALNNNPFLRATDFIL